MERRIAMNRPEIKSGMVTNNEPGYWFGFGLAVLAQFAIVGLIAFAWWLVKR
jgi:hypothetical protein